MQVGPLPSSATATLIEGCCVDFVALASVLAQTLEQVSSRNSKLGRSRPQLERLERGMREMAATIRDLLERGQEVAEVEIAPRRPETDAKHVLTAPEPTQEQKAAPKLTPDVAPPPAARDTAKPATPARPIDPMATAPRPTQAPAAPAPQQPPASPSPMRAMFASLEADRRGGTLYVQAGRETLAFEFVGGCITQTANDGVVTDERLGNLLVELGSCTRDQLARAFAKMNPDQNHLLGEMLVRECTVSNRQIVAALEQQVQRRVRRACATADAHFDFADGELLADDGRVRVAPSAAWSSADDPFA